jgi:hypothetical protein
MFNLNFIYKMRSVNQNHHLYVVKGVGSAISESSDLGMIAPFVVGDNPKERDLYFLYKGRDCVTRSDLIPVNQITYVKYIPASAQQTPLRRVSVALDSTINSGNPVQGEDYVLNIEFQQFYGLSPENTYVKTVAVHIGPNITTPSLFYDAMIDALNAAFSREVGATATSNPYLTFTKNSLSGGGYNLIIEEKEQPWSLGKWEAESLMFNVFPSTIRVSGSEVNWGTATVETPANFVANSKKMADLEWFTFGERADFYRGMGYPNNFDFTPMVDSSNASGYDVLEIHYAYQGTCEDIQKSEKDITLIAKSSDGYIEDLVGDINGLNPGLGFEISTGASDDPSGTALEPEP